MSTFSQSSFKDLLKDIELDYSHIFNDRFSHLICITSHKNHFIGLEYDLLIKIEKKIKNMQSSIYKDDAVSFIFDLDAKMLQLVGILKNKILNHRDKIFSNIFQKFLYIYSSINRLCLKLERLYNHEFVYAKKIYGNFRSEIEKSLIMNDSPFYKECLKMYQSHDFNFTDYTYKSVCDNILFCYRFQDKIRQKEKTIKYYESRCEKSMNLCDIIKNEFFEIAYSPELVNKIVWNEKEFDEYKNMFRCAV